MEPNAEWNSGWLDIFLRYLGMLLALVLTLTWIGGRGFWPAAWAAIWLAAASAWWRRPIRHHWRHALRASAATAAGTALALLILMRAGQIPVSGWSIADSAVAVTLVEYALARYPLARWLSQLAVHQHRVP